MKMFEKLEKTGVNRTETKKVVKPCVKPTDVKSEECKQDGSVSQASHNNLKECRQKTARRRSDCVSDVSDSALTPSTAMTCEKDQLEYKTALEETTKTEQTASEQPKNDNNTTTDVKKLLSDNVNENMLPEKCIKTEENIASDFAKVESLDENSAVFVNKSEKESIDDLSDDNSMATKMCLRNKNNSAAVASVKSKNVNGKTGPGKLKHVGGINKLRSKNLVGVQHSTKGKKIETCGKTKTDSNTTTKSDVEKEGKSNAAEVAAKTEDSEIPQVSGAKVGSEEQILATCNVSFYQLLMIDDRL